MNCTNFTNLNVNIQICKIRSIRKFVAPVKTSDNRSPLFETTD